MPKVHQSTDGRLAVLTLPQNLDPKGSSISRPKVYKLKKPVADLEDLTVGLELMTIVEPPKKEKKVYKLKNQPPVADIEEITETLADLHVEKRPIIKLKKPLLTVPPPPPYGYALTKAGEAFEALREYYETRDEPISQADLRWYQEEIEQEKKDRIEFWSYCAITEAIMDATIRGINDEVTLMKIEMEAKKKQKSMPIRESDIGPMPTYGSPEFWAWCRKRKQLKEQKEASKTVES